MSEMKCDENANCTNGSNNCSCNYGHTNYDPCQTTVKYDISTPALCLA